MIAKCGRCGRRLKDGHWIFSRWTTSRYCYAGEGCQEDQEEGARMNAYRKTEAVLLALLALNILILIGRYA